MVCARVLIVLAMLRAFALADPPPTIEDALAHAAAAGKPLVVEFGAVWCKPCRDFEDHVLTLPEVKKAIAAVEYVRYDIDTNPGDAAARRYGVSSVPAFFILGADGTAIERRTGAGDAHWFLDLLARSRARTASSSDLERAVTEHPDGIPERLRLASHYRAVGKISDAAIQLRAVIDLPNVGRAIAATTTAELDDMVAADARLQTTVDTALAFVTKFPESPLATPRLAILIATGRVPSAQLADLVHEHLDNVPPAGLPDAIRVAMLAGAPTEAKLALSRLAPGYEARLLRAELDLVLHDHEDAAREVIASVCSKLPADFELRCFALQQSIRARQSPAGVSMLAARASRYVQALETPIAPATIVSLSELANDELAFGNVLARGLLNARARCADVVSGPTHAFVVAVPAHQPSAGRSKMMIQATTNLQRCLHEQLDDIVFPSTTARLENGVYARIDVRSELQDTWPEPPDPIVVPVNGAVVFASARVGGVDAAGVGASGLVDITSLATLRLIARAELEVGRGDSATYAARGLFGLGIPGRGAVFGFFGGAGVSRFGDSVPRGTELLWEMTIKVLSGKLNYHFAFRSTHVYDAPMRKDPSGGSDALGGDEIGVALGASLPLFGRRVFVAGSVEHRALGDTELFLVGVPLGSFY